MVGLLLTPSFIFAFAVISKPDLVAPKFEVLVGFFSRVLVFLVGFFSRKKKDLVGKITEKKKHFFSRSYRNLVGGIHPPPRREAVRCSRLCSILGWCQILNRCLLAGVKVAGNHREPFFKELNGVSPEVGGVVCVVFVLLSSCALDVLSHNDDSRVAGVHVVAVGGESVNDSLH